MSVATPLQTATVALGQLAAAERLAGNAFGFKPVRSVMLKSKSTPIRSKKLSVKRMKRTSMVTCRSCRRTELFQQIGDPLVNSLRLADDKAEVRGEGLNFALARTVFHPTFVLDGGNDEVDERVEVGTRGAAQPAWTAHRARLSDRWPGRRSLLWTGPLPPVTRG